MTKKAAPATASLRAVSRNILVSTAVILMTINTVVIVALTDWSVQSTLNVWRTAFVITALLAATTGYWAVRRGRARVASAILVVTVWLSVTAFALGSGIGLHTAALYFYLPCLLYSALFFGLGVAGVQAALTALALFAMYRAEATGLIGGVQAYLSSTTPFNFLLGVLVSCIATLVLAAVYHRRIETEAASVQREAEARRRAMLELEASQEELARASLEVRKLNAELERAVALRTLERDQVHQELDSVNYSVAHDLRAPLRAMHSYASMVLERADPAIDPEARDMLRRVRSAADRMDTLLRALLAFGDIGRRPLRIEAVNLSAIATEALARRAKALGVEAPQARVDPDLHARGDRDLDGVGMGLATARRIAERHGGALWAKAAPGEGATFYFSLNPPAAKAA
ncbi:MAG TPA: histidine kinase dimerization/phospho-acceptor domain-containing protein [Burkholderiales bacterium]